MCRADGRVRVIGAIREIGGKSAQRELLPEGFDHDGRNPTLAKLGWGTPVFVFG